MREIKFKNWDGNKMYDPWSLSWLIKDAPDDFTSSDFGNMKILLEYTGLKDKNGKEIYEGDILGAGISVIKIQHKGRGFEGVYLNREEITESPLPNNNYNYWEIIGNIYQNPELVK